ncbi:molybdenum cofactor guanylyltransferase [Winogradskyella forsetii]|uniref:molybdenum cofactor guanylyltransferase n=1 Tax=Winogradskyella forsetii TaxID=2686077 RepID=UPI0015BC2685|nr:molybdenum cofactor guanylyltransferase [Winogradskyella forsetii]
MRVHNNITVYILCGGLSTRMQEEKGLVVFKGKTFVDHIIEAVKPITQNIVLVTNNEKYEQFGYPLVADIYENKGPVGGIYSALNHSQDDHNLILSCDIPNINTAVLNNYLLNTISENQITYLVDNQGEYPLIGLYSKKVTSIFKEAILKNELKLLDLIKSLDYKTISIKRKDRNAVKNVNSKEDLQLLLLNN